MGIYRDTWIAAISAFSSEKFSFNITLQQGKNYTYNISVGKNFEVVITE